MGLFLSLGSALVLELSDQAHGVIPGKKAKTL